MSEIGVCFRLFLFLLGVVQGLGFCRSFPVRLSIWLDRVFFGLCLGGAFGLVLWFDMVVWRVLGGLM